ncbi:MAG: hypothetical protein LBM77_10175 [Spirochaetaceae bacterium]|jgi:hypothetical protein|nr:hypothetical protein [Spirochaetaceae bacterium]
MDTEKKVANLRKRFNDLPETEKDAVLTAAKKLLEVQNLNSDVLERQEHSCCSFCKKDRKA